jgi:anti-anti-sigma factor
MDIFEIERDERTIIVTPLADLRELDYEQIEAGATEVLTLLNQPPVKNVIIDFHRTDSYGTTALGFFVKVWKRVKSGHGNMAFCNVSDHEMEILKITKLDNVWPICSSREEALRVINA